MARLKLSKHKLLAKRKHWSENNGATSGCFG
jgi:hypothetical protein